MLWFLWLVIVLLSWFLHLRWRFVFYHLINRILLRLDILFGVISWAVLLYLQTWFQHVCTHYFNLLIGRTNFISVCCLLFISLLLRLISFPSSLIDSFGNFDHSQTSIIRSFSTEEWIILPVWFQSGWILSSCDIIVMEEWAHRMGAHAEVYIWIYLV